MLSDNEQFRRCLVRRSHLIERLDETRLELDQKLEQFAVQSTVTDLAYLEGLLHVRRGFLNDLAKLDEEIIELIIAVQLSSRSNDGR